MVTARLGLRHEQNDVFFWDSPRPSKSFTVKLCERGEWAKFRRYHYLNADLPSASVCYGLYDDESIIGFCAVLHQPHGKINNLKRCTRLVILPDYQGIGIGAKFLTFVAGIYASKGFEFSIVTSAKNMISSLNRSRNWQMIRYSVNKCSSNKSAIDYKRPSMRSNCKTASFMYIGEHGKTAEKN